MCKKWIPLDSEKSKEYETTCIKCKNCKKIALPYFVHDKCGDWTCFNCDEEGYIKHFCVYCKFKN